jgi:hypothetical protein
MVVVEAGAPAGSSPVAWAMIYGINRGLGLCPGRPQRRGSSHSSPSASKASVMSCFFRTCRFTQSDRLRT